MCGKDCLVLQAGSKTHCADLPSLLEEAHAPHSQLEAEEEEPMVRGLCVLVVRVLCTPVVLIGSLLYVRQKKWQTTAYWESPERSFQD
jgi:hypothetical protein